MCELKLLCTFYRKIFQVRHKYTKKVEFYQKIAFLFHDMKCENNIKNTFVIENIKFSSKSQMIFRI